MSPYRVLVKNDQNEYKVLVAQAKPDKNIYIYERFQENTLNSKTLTSTELAHKPIPKSNSVKVGRYRIERDADEIHYRVAYIQYKHEHYLADMNLLQTECLVTAMNHHCNLNQYQILCEL